jgi:hypothetical protein
MTKKRMGRPSIEYLIRSIDEELHRTTGRCEASFASKLSATIGPTMPVIDSVVLRNLNLRLPPSGSSNESPASERSPRQARDLLQ